MADSVSTTDAAPVGEATVAASVAASGTYAAEPARQIVQVGPNTLTLFDLAPELMDAMAANIRQARQRVWLESYIISDDAAGNAIADALIDRAKSGLDVRVLYDAVGSYATPRAFFRRLTDGGVLVHAYHTLGEAVRKLAFFSVFNRRNHRKLLVIDDQIGYFGGMNIVDQRGLDSVEDVKRRDLPLSAGYRDVHVRLDGPADQLGHLGAGRPQVAQVDGVAVGVVAVAFEGLLRGALWREEAVDQGQGEADRSGAGAEARVATARATAKPRTSAAPASRSNAVSAASASRRPSSGSTCRSFWPCTTTIGTSSMAAMSAAGMSSPRNRRAQPWSSTPAGDHPFAGERSCEGPAGPGWAAPAVVIVTPVASRPSLLVAITLLPVAGNPS